MSSTVPKPQEPAPADQEAAQPHLDHVPEGLRHTSEAAAELASRVLDALTRRLHHHDTEATEAQGGTAAGGAEHEHHADSVPEGLRHTSEAAAELASRVVAAVSARLHRGHELRKGEEGGSGGGGHGSGTGHGSREAHGRKE